VIVSRGLGLGGYGTIVGSGLGVSLYVSDGVAISVDILSIDSLLLQTDMLYGHSLSTNTIASSGSIITPNHSSGSTLFVPYALGASGLLTPPSASAGSLIFLSPIGVEASLLVPEIYLAGANILVLNYRKGVISDVVFIGREDLAENIDLVSLTGNPTLDVSSINVSIVPESSVESIVLPHKISSTGSVETISIAKDDSRSNEILVIYTDNH